MNLNQRNEIVREIKNKMLRQADYGQRDPFGFHDVNDFKDHLKIRLDKGSLSINQQLIYLKHRPMTLKLIQAFMHFSDSGVTREQLIEQVYGCKSKDSSEVSARVYLCYYQNLVKLLSRSRNILSDAMSSFNSSLEIEWFPFVKTDEKWRFFHIVER